MIWYLSNQTVVQIDKSLINGRIYIILNALQIVLHGFLSLNYLNYFFVDLFTLITAIRAEIDINIKYRQISVESNEMKTIKLYADSMNNLDKSPAKKFSEKDALNTKNLHKRPTGYHLSIEKPQIINISENQNTGKEDEKVPSINSRLTEKNTDSAPFKQPERELKRTQSSRTLKMMKAAEERIKTNFTNDPIRIFNPTSMFDLGMITQVIFGKTGTLTTGDIQIGGLTTTLKMYAIDLDSMEASFKAIQKNPDQYIALEEDSFDQSDAYSEKSQEYRKEIEGDYISEIFEEDSGLSDLFEDPALRKFDAFNAEFGAKDNSKISIPYPLERKDTITQTGSPQRRRSKFFIKQIAGRELGKKILKIEKTFLERLKNQDANNLNQTSTQKYKMDISSEDEGPSLHFKTTQLSPQELFLSDANRKKTEVMELITSMLLCYDKPYQPVNKNSEMHIHDESIRKVCNILGFEVKLDNMLDSTKFIRSYKVLQNGIPQNKLNIIGINDLSKRGRMSIVINDPSKGRLNSEIIVKGSYEFMKDCLRLTKADSLKMKQLISRYRIEGLTPEIYAKKTLTVEEVIEFYEAFRITLNNSGKAYNNQNQVIDNVISMLEKNLEFIGCLGVKEIVRPEAKVLAKKLKQAGISLGIITSDSLHNGLQVAKELEYFPKEDMNAEFWIKGKTLRDISSDVKRIINTIYSEIKEKKVVSLEKMAKDLKMPWYVKKANPDHNLAITSEQENKQRILIISGDSLRLISSSKVIISNLRFVMRFANCIIAHNFNWEDKVLLISLMKLNNKKVLAIGNAFNDITMLRIADVGIQLTCRDVHVIFGDITVNSISVVSDILFQKSRSCFRRTLILEILGFWIAVNYTWMSWVYLGYSFNSEVLFKGYPALTLISVQTLYAFIMVVIDSENENMAVNAFPLLYRQSQTLHIYIFRLAFAIVVYAGLQSTYIMCMLYYVLINFYIGEFQTLSMNQIITISHCIFLTAGLAKVSYISYTGRPIIYGLGIVLLIFTLTAEYISISMLGNDSKTRSTISHFFNYRILTVGILTATTLCYVDWLIINFVKSKYFRDLENQVESIYHKSRSIKLTIALGNVMKFLESKSEELLSKNITFKRLSRIFKTIGTSSRAIKEKISKLDSNFDDLQIQPLTCLILDKAQRKRYRLYKTDIEILNTFIWLSLVSLAALIKYFAGALILGENILRLYDIHAYWFIVFLALLIAFKFDISKRKFDLILVCTVSVTVILQLILTAFFKRSTVSMIDLFSMRVLTGTIYIEYIYLMLLYPLMVFIFITDILISWDNNILTIHLDPYTVFRIIVGGSIITFGWLMFKHKYQSLQKQDYLSKLNIAEELSRSKEKISMLMPSFIVEKMDSYDISQNFMADDAGEVAVLFCDICKFNDVVVECQDNIIDILDEVFRAFDYFCKQEGVQKIETVGKTYMVCGGLKFLDKDLTEEQKMISSTQRILNVAQSMMSFMDEYNYKPGKKLRLKIGIHYGNCIYGVLGYHKPQFSLIGDTINMTSRHCTTGIDGTIIISQQAYDQLKDKKLKVLIREVEMKGKGRKLTYVIQRKETNLETKVDSPSKQVHGFSILASNAIIGMNPNFSSSRRDFSLKNEFDNLFENPLNASIEGGYLRPSTIKTLLDTPQQNHLNSSSGSSISENIGKDISISEFPQESAAPFHSKTKSRKSPRLKSRRKMITLFKDIDLKSQRAAIDALIKNPLFWEYYLEDSLKKNKRNIEIVGILLFIDGFTQSMVYMLVFKNSDTIWSTLQWLGVVISGYFLVLYFLATLNSKPEYFRRLILIGLLLRLAYRFSSMIYAKINLEEEM